MFVKIPGIMTLINNMEAADSTTFAISRADGPPDHRILMCLDFVDTVDHLPGPRLSRTRWGAPPRVRVGSWGKFTVPNQGSREHEPQHKFC